MSASTPLLPFDGTHIPEQLIKETRWAPWRALWNAKRGKWDKIPHRADNPEYGISTARPGQWFAYEKALAAFQRGGRFAGVGYCMTGPHGVVGVDLDGCVTSNGRIAPWAREVIDALGSYTEISPSGTGLRIMGLGEVATDWNNHEVGIEVYGGNEARFLTITGRHVEGTATELVALPAEALAGLAKRYAREKRKAEVIDLNIPDVLDEILLPEVGGLSLPDRVEQFLLTGECDGDRSGLVHAAGVALYAAGLGDEEVFSVLATNDYAMAVALDHRRQDHDRALLYLWREHCCKAKVKAQDAVASPEEFAVLAPLPEGEKALPRFTRDRHGRIEATAGNVVMALGRPDYCGMRVGFDQFRDEIMFAAPGTDDWRTFGDADYMRLRIGLEAKGFKPIGRELIRDSVLLVADENPFDSAVVWIESLKWDGVSRIERFLPAYFNTEDTDYTRAVSLYMWTAMAGRVLEPGIKADMVPILVGAQGSGKSSGVAAMAPAHEFFTEVSFSEREDDLSRKMRGCLLAEIGELRGLHTRELESIKAFITRTHETWVPKYREFAVQFPRRLVFIGTTNQHEFLADETGNRRWLPVLTNQVDRDAIKADCALLWAEAREVFKVRGVVFKGAEQLANEAHADHTLHDTWVEVIAEWLDTEDSLTGEIPRIREFLRLTDVARDALGLNVHQITRTQELRIGKCLRECGYEKRVRKIEREDRKVWVQAIPFATYARP